MQVRVNGETLDLPGGETVAMLLGRLKLGGAPCAVEVNETLVPKKSHDERQLQDGDAVEIVTLVGGG
jgi:sulfur carrier protein